MQNYKFNKRVCKNTYLIGKACFSIFESQTLRVLLICMIWQLLACSNTDVSSSQEQVARQQTPGPECARLLSDAIDATTLYSYDRSIEMLIASKNNVCVRQIELASVDQLLSSIYVLTQDYENALNHLALAIDRDVLNEDLQKQSIYKAAQLSYLLQSYHQALAYMQRFENTVQQMEPNEHVLMARCLYAVERHDEALGIMVNLFARHRNGEIVMKDEWIDFLRGLQDDSGVSMG